MRIDRVYTRGGDQGETSLIGGERVSKASARPDGYGTVGVARSTSSPPAATRTSRKPR